MGGLTVPSVNKTFPLTNKVALNRNSAVESEVGVKAFVAGSYV